MTRLVAGNNTRLVHADVNFEVDGKPVSKMPIAINDAEGVVVTLQAYLLEGCARLADHWRTAEKHGYVLCQWYDYLARIDVHIFDAHEDHLRNFLLGAGRRVGNVVALGKGIDIPSTKTNRAKFKIIVSFYDFWESKRGQALKSLRGTNIANIPDTLFKREHRSAYKAEINFSKSIGSASKRRAGTPDDEDWERVVDKVLSLEDQNRAQTYYLIGSLARRSGSRGHGIHGLTVTEFLKGLIREKAFKKTKDYRAVIKEYSRPEHRLKIVEALNQMASARRKFIFCDVPNKGGRELVPIAVPIELAIEIFDYMCTRRADVIRTRFAGKNVPENIFLSYKTRQAGGALTQEGMGNFFNNILKELEIDGTFHRLRAAFCQEVVRDIYIRERAINGRAWQVNNVLEFARKLLGHKNPHSLEHYLNEVLAEEVLFGEPVMVDNPEDVSYVRAIAARLNDSASDVFRENLHRFVREQGLEPIAEHGRKYALF